MKHTKKLCACGFPQSYPIPHEHGQTEREKVIIKHFRDGHKELLGALKGIYETRNGIPLDLSELARKAIAKAEGK